MSSEREQGSWRVASRDLSRWHRALPPSLTSALLQIPGFACSSGYDVQSAATPDGVLYITGAPRYNHTGRVVVYRLNKKGKIAVSQIIKGEQVSVGR